MKKRRLKKWVKNMIAIIVAVIIYCLLGKYGYLAVKSDFWGNLILVGWVYMFFGNMFVFWAINSEKERV